MAACLKLNADGNPVSVIPLSTMTWKEAVKAMVEEKITVLEWHENWIVRSVSWETRVPAVVILKNYEKRRDTIRFSKQNVFLRDLYICQYCGVHTGKKPTLDHVLPQSHGGKSTYENTVCACADCNARKGNDKKVRPKKMPTKPTYHQLVDARRRLPIEGGHPSWATYLGIK